MKKVLLIDGHNLLFRMFFGIPSAIRNSKGKDIRGVVGFIGSIKKLVEEFKPYSIVVIFDSETSRDNNLRLDSEYKAGREDFTNVEDDDNPFSQLPYIYQALDVLGIKHLEVYGNEADDYIASLIERDNSFQYVIVSTDSDFIQLVSENCLLYVPRGKQSVLYDRKRVLEKYGVTSDKYVLFKALIGDKTDNIKGIRGIGPKTAAMILQYDSLEGYIKNNFNSRLSKLLDENEKVISKNVSLITLNRFIETGEVIFDEVLEKVYEFKTYEVIDDINLR